jgi:D-alanyl-D-alanine carboxypeptidase
MADLQEIFARLDTFVKRRMQADRSPGLALAATDREGLLHIATYGYADIAAKAPVAPDTLFEIGSISKSVAAIALLQMVEAGQVDLHAPVARYLPWFHVPSSYQPITLHHLLSHTAGIIRGSDFSTEARYEVWALRESIASTPPGSYYHYSNVGYKALGLVLEEVSGQAYPAIIRERIFDPLCMESSEPAITHDTRQRLAVGYRRFYEDRPGHPIHPLVPATWLEADTADGSIATTASDLATYLRVLINRGQSPRGHILAPESFQLMTRPVIEPPESDEDHGTFYGYGLNICNLDGHPLIGHGGSTVGYCAHVLADPEDGLGVVVLINGPGEPGEIAGFALALLRAAYRDEPLPPLPEAPEMESIELAAEYAGTYKSQTTTFTLEALDGRLVMHTGGVQVTLEQRGVDRFYVPHPEWQLFLLHLVREEGQVVEAVHGPDWYAGERYTGPSTFDTPPAWSAFPGHYRSHNPWYSNFRVVLRNGNLAFIDATGEEEVLAPLDEGLFRVGADARSPERLQFDTVLDGRAVRASLSGCDYYRTFTP